jgi:hypothetical protein
MVGLRTGDHVAVRQGDADRGSRCLRICIGGERGTELEHPRPLTGVLRAGDLVVRAVHQRIAAIAEQPACSDAALAGSAMAFALSGNASAASASKSKAAAQRSELQVPSQGDRRGQQRRASLAATLRACGKRAYQDQLNQPDLG